MCLIFGVNNAFVFLETRILATRTTLHKLLVLALLSGKAPILTVKHFVEVFRVAPPTRTAKLSLEVRRVLHDVIF